MLRTDVEKVLSRLYHSPIKQEVLNELSKIIPKPDQNPRELTGEQLGNLVGIILGKPILKRLSSHEFCSIMTIFHDLFRSDFFNPFTQRLLWNVLHRKGIPLDDLQVQLESFIKNKKVFDKPDYLRGLCEYTAYTDWPFCPNFFERLKQTVILFHSALNSEQKSTTTREISSFEFQVICHIVKIEADATNNLEPQILFLIQFIEAGFSQQPYLQAILIKHVQQQGEIGNLVKYLIALKVNGVLNEHTASADIQNEHTGNYLVDIFVILNKNNFALTMRLKGVPSGNHILNMSVTFYKFLNLNDATQLARTKKSVNAIFQPPLNQCNIVFRIKRLLTHKYYHGNRDIVDFTRLIKHLDEHGLCTPSNVTLCLDYFLFLSSYAMHDVVTKINNQQTFEDFIKSIVVDNWVTHIRHALDSLEDNSEKKKGSDKKSEIKTQPIENLHPKTILQNELARIKKRPEVSPYLYHKILKHLLKETNVLRDQNLIKVLLAEGVKINFNKPYRSEILDDIARYGAPESAELLLNVAWHQQTTHPTSEIKETETAFRARIFSQSGHRGRTMLHLAVQELNVPMVQFLADKEDPLTEDDSGFPVLFQGNSQYNWTNYERANQVVAILVTENRLCLNKKNSNNITPLEHAFGGSDIVRIHALLKHGALLYPNNSTRIIDKLLLLEEKTSQSAWHIREDRPSQKIIWLLLFYHRDKLRKEDEDRLWKTLNPQNLKHDLTKFDLHMCVQLCLYLMNRDFIILDKDNHCRLELYSQMYRCCLDYLHAHQFSFDVDGKKNINQNDAFTIIYFMAELDYLNERHLKDILPILPIHDMHHVMNEVLGKLFDKYKAKQNGIKLFAEKLFVKALFEHGATIPPELIQNDLSGEFKEILSKRKLEMKIKFNSVFDVSTKIKEICKKSAQNIPHDIFNNPEKKKPSQVSILPSDTKDEKKRDQDLLKKDNKKNNQDSLLKLWNNMKELIGNQNTRVIGQELFVHLLQLMIALNNMDFVEATRIAIAGLKNFPDQNLTKGVHANFAEFLQLQDYKKDQNKDPVTWAAELLPCCYQELFNARFLKERESFLNFLYNNSDDGIVFCQTFVNLKFEANDLGNQLCIGKLMREYHDKLEFDPTDTHDPIVQGRRQHGLMKSIELTPVEDFKAVKEFKAVKH